MSSAFTKTELDNLEFVINSHISYMAKVIKDRESPLRVECAEDQKNTFEELLEKVRRMSAKV